MLIIEKAQNISGRLKRIDAAREGVNETNALDTLRAELLLLAAPLHRVAENVRTFSEQNGEFSSVPDLGSVIETVRNVSERFREIPKSTTLRQGSRWSSLTSKLLALATKLKEVHESDWRLFFDANYFGGIPPVQREAKLILAIPGNKEAISAYKTLYQNLSRYRQKMPQSAAEFDELRRTSAELSAIEFSEENIPPDVRKFFEATGFGANLSLLTSEVLEWLRSNDLLDRYVVRAKSN